jgi:GNAT superfamily N-acetyltransferase
MRSVPLRCAAVEVRTVEATDTELCAALGAMVLEAYVRLPGHIEEPEYELELADVAGRAGLPHTAVLAAFDDDGVALGCLTYASSPASPMAELVGEGEAGFRMLGVDPAAQGRGAGRALVAACIERARADGRRALCLHSTPWMRTAHGLYESFGFVRDPARDWSPVPGIDLVAYRLALSPT